VINFWNSALYPNAFAHSQMKRPKYPLRELSHTSVKFVQLKSHWKNHIESQRELTHIDFSLYFVMFQYHTKVVAL